MTSPAVILLQHKQYVCLYINMHICAKGTADKLDCLFKTTGSWHVSFGEFVTTTFSFAMCHYICYSNMTVFMDLFKITESSLSDKKKSQCMNSMNFPVWAYVMHPWNSRKQTAHCTSDLLFAGPWCCHSLLSQDLPSVHLTTPHFKTNTDGCKYICYLHYMGTRHEKVNGVLLQLATTLVSSVRRFYAALRPATHEGITKKIP